MCVLYNRFMELGHRSNNNPLILAVVINAIVLVFYIAVFGMGYEDHDDLAIAVLVREQYYYLGFVNYFLCVIAHGFGLLVPFANGWVLLQLSARSRIFSSSRSPEERVRFLRPSCLSCLHTTTTR